MKQIFITGLLCIALSAVHSESFAEDRNTIRVGTGINIVPSMASSGTGIGPSLYMEYGRKVNRYLSLSAVLHTDMYEYDSSNCGNNIQIGVSALARPFASVKWMKWLEAGAGLSCRYTADFTGEKDIEPIFGTTYYKVARPEYIRPGLDFQIRGYMIDSPRFDLYVFCRCETGFTQGWTFRWQSIDCGLMFGVKF